MNEYSTEVWKYANPILQKFEGMWQRNSSRNFSKEKREESRDKFMALLHPADEAEDCSVAKPGVEDFEYALQTAVMSRLEDGDDEEQVLEVIHMLEVTAAIVEDIFHKAAKQGAHAADTDRCKTWWTMFFQVAEDVSRLIPARHIEQLVGEWENSLVRLRAAYLQLASARLGEVDAKQAEQEQKKDEDADGKDQDSKNKESKDKEAKDKEASKESASSKETKRIEERKKLINHLSVSPNGQLYLTLTSLLKQLASRLTGSMQASVRARIVLLLERLLAMDHKAIANNQKAKSQDFVQAEDLDTVEDASNVLAKGLTAAGGSPIDAADDNKDTPNAQDTKNDKDGSSEITGPGGNGAPAMLSGSPEVDADFYHSFWGLQDVLQYPEKALEKSENWQTFHKSLSKVLTLFEKHPVQDARRQPWAEPEPMPLRHAPRADAFRVQLDDPGFRQQFLAQAMIAFSALEQDASSKLGLHSGLIFKSPESIKKEFFSLKQTCEAVLEQTRPGFPRLLKHALEREAHWLQWKGYGCREFLRESSEMLYGKLTPGDELMQNPTKEPLTKPKLGFVTSMLKALRDPQWRVSSASPDATPEDVGAQMQTIKASKMCEANLDRLAEEDKPENDIEEEYKAKKNKVFMWQSRRLFCQQYLQIFAFKENHNKSDFMEFVKTVRKPPPDTRVTTSAETATEATGTAATAGSPPASGEEAGDAVPEGEDEAMPAASVPASGEVTQEATVESSPAPAVETGKVSTPGVADAGSKREAPVAEASDSPPAKKVKRD